MYLVLIFAAAVTFTIGGAFMKASEGMTRLKPTLLSHLCFAVGATFQALALRDAELGVAYMFSLGLEVLLLFMLGQLFFAEAASKRKVLGVVSIVVGMILMHHGDPVPNEQAGQSSDSAAAQVTSRADGIGTAAEDPTPSVFVGPAVNETTGAAR